MAEPGILFELGIRASDILAGFCGGVVNAFVLKRSEPWSIIGSVVVGGITANYLTEPFMKYLGTGQGTAAFLVGLAGMAVCQGVIGAAKNWTPFGRSNPDAPRPPS